VKKLANQDKSSWFEMADWFYQILKRTLLCIVVCHGSVLDVGCGEGSFPNRERIAGLDVDRKRLKNCRYEYRVLGDVCSLPFKSKSFDVAVEMNCLPYSGDWRKGLKEMQRVGKRVYLIEPLRRRKRLHWFSLPELLSLGVPMFFILRTLVVAASKNSGNS